MSAPPAPELAPPLPRTAFRLAVLLAMAGLLLAPWVVVQEPVAGRSVAEIGAVRAGAPALLALVAAWGLALGVRAARTRAGLRGAEAFTAASVAAAVGALLLLDHPWIPGGDRRAAWLPVFLPLALLAGFEGVLRRRASGAGRDVGRGRVAASAFAALALAADERWLLAGAAGWLALAPLVLSRAGGAPGARRTLEGLALLPALTLGFTLSLQRRLVPLRPLAEGGTTLPIYAWTLLAALLVLLAAAGLLDPEDRPVATGAGTAPGR